MCLAFIICAPRFRCRCAATSRPAGGRNGVGIKPVGQMDPQPGRRRVVRPERKHRLRHGHQAEAEQRQHDQRPFQRPGAGVAGRVPGRQPFRAALQREVADRGGEREQRRAPGQRARGGVGQPLRQQIGHAEDQDRAQRDGLRRLVREAEATGGRYTSHRSPAPAPKALRTAAPSGHGHRAGRADRGHAVRPRRPRPGRHAPCRANGPRYAAAPAETAPGRIAGS